MTTSRCLQQANGHPRKIKNHCYVLITTKPSAQAGVRHSAALEGIRHKVATMDLIRRKLRSGAKTRSAPIFVEYDIDNARVASTGYEGLPLKGGEIVGVHELRQMGFKVVSVQPEDTRCIVGMKNGIPYNILGAVHGTSMKPQVVADISAMNNFIAASREELLKRKRKEGHETGDENQCRGDFWGLQTGMGRGQGSPNPHQFRLVGAEKKVMGEMVANPLFKKLAAFQSDSLGIFAPKIHKYMKKGVEKIERKTNARRPFKNSPFAALTVNFGPQTVCKRHVDQSNLAGAFCAITALGDYNPTQGGHIVLWEFKLVIEFPPGATVLIPSALISHGNVPVASNEYRYSFTQYAAGSLFRWVENGCCSNVELFKQFRKEAHNEDEANEREREWLQWQKDNNWKGAVKRFKAWKGGKKI